VHFHCGWHGMRATRLFLTCTTSIACPDEAWFLLCLKNVISSKPLCFPYLFPMCFWMCGPNQKASESGTKQQRKTKWNELFRVKSRFPGWQSFKKIHVSSSKYGLSQPNPSKYAVTVSWIAERRYCNNFFDHLHTHTKRNRSINYLLWQFQRLLWDCVRLQLHTFC